MVNFRRFREVFRSFREVFQSFRKFFEFFASFSRLSDPFGPIGMHSDAFGSNWKRLDVFEIFEIFWIFESFFNVSGRNFYKRLFSRHNMQRKKVVADKLTCSVSIRSCQKAQEAETAVDQAEK